jgi:phosphoadenosine phosphosulfate reductase
LWSIPKVQRTVTEPHVQRALSRLWEFEPHDGYWVAFSGGKDSLCVHHLVEEAGVGFEAHYNLCPDPPELIQFMRSEYPEVQRDLPPRSLWRLIEHHGVPPTRLLRYCCQELKERGGEGRFVVTGVRWAESYVRRVGRGIVEIDTGGRRKRILMQDNDEARRMLEFCTTVGKHILNPIIDWSEEQVWGYIRSRGLRYCPLYDERDELGRPRFTRVGCIACPMSGPERRRYDLTRWPKYRENYLRAFDRMLARRRERNLPTTWQTAQEVMDWWLEGSPEPGLDL